MLLRLCSVFAILFLFIQLMYAQIDVDEAEQSDFFEIDTLRMYELKPRFGIFGHYALNLHTAHFAKLPGVEHCCPNYRFGLGSGAVFGALLQYPLFNYYEGLNFDLRAGYYIKNALLEREEAETLIIDGEYRPGLFKHSLDSYFHSIGIEPGVSYNFYETFLAHFAFRIGFKTYDHFEQKEIISKPKDRAVFVDNGLQTRNHISGEVPEANSINFGFSLGISYERPLNTRGSLYAAPELFYSFDISPLVKGLSWNPHQIRFGVAIKYKEPIPPPPPPLPPLAPPSPELPEPPDLGPLIVNVKAVKVDTLGREHEKFNLLIEDFVSLNMRPLLTYVFFDENSYQIPGRYVLLSKNQLSRFNISQLQTSGVLSTYYHVLNIIGSRLEQYPEANITITGNNQDRNEEKGNRELSQKRAETVRDYFRDIWNIDEKRMRIVARNLPQQATRDDVPEGMEENRRVEINSNDPRITEPVISIDTMRVLSTETIRFYPEIQNTIGIKNWNLKVNHGSTVMTEFDGNLEPPDYMDWELSENSHTPQKAGNLIYTLSVTDSLGRTVNSPRLILPVEQLTIDRKRLERIKDMEFEYYSLILFDFGTTQLASDHRSVVDVIKQRITPDATVFIRGYTDTMGDEDINRRIAEQRAQAVARRLNIRGAKVEGIGKDEILYDNTLPEGRFYCRTVQITIETPVKE